MCSHSLLMPLCKLTQTVTRLPIVLSEVSGSKSRMEDCLMRDNLFPVCQEKHQKNKACSKLDRGRLLLYVSQLIFDCHTVIPRHDHHSVYSARAVKKV